MIELERPPVTENAVLVRLALPQDREEEINESLDELERLADTAGAHVLCRFVQHRPTPDSATLIGEGKIQEIRAACEELGATLVLFDSELTPNQGSKLEKILDLKVVDRSQLILDIFAQHAHTSEGKLQVELAQLNYILPRLAGRGSVMRQQGGIGVRGPGEQKLEVDRRVIRNRMDKIKRELEAVKRARRVQRKHRSETSSGTVALVGYTNAGKSSLLNALSGANLYVADQLFATLDPRSRKCVLPSRRQIVLTDTVGFIRKLPHTLIAAFRATLEETLEADLLIHVADSSQPGAEDQISAVHDVLDEIGAGEKPTLMVFNKIDAATPEQLAALSKDRPNALAVSAHTKEGLDALLAQIDVVLANTRRRVRLRLPQSEAGVVAQIHKNGRILEQSYEGNDILIDAEVDEALHGRLTHCIE